MITNGQLLSNFNVYNKLNHRLNNCNNMTNCSPIRKNLRLPEATDQKNIEENVEIKQTFN